MIKTLNVDLIKTLINGRDTYIWGSGHFGVALYYLFARFNIKIKGFLDSNIFYENFHGFHVEKPETILNLGIKQNFIINASALYANELSEICEQNGFTHFVDYLNYSDLKPYHFEIDISGMCNLRCLTCPRGNCVDKPSTKMMSFDAYKKVLDKLLFEMPTLPDVQLYSWGEPLLNPELPKILLYSHNKGIATAISSNLSLNSDLESIVKAMPTWFRISLSGSNEKEYSIVHKGGNFSLVLKNMHLLSELRQKYYPNMFIEVNYHLYKHNLGGVKRMAEICHELGFILRTNYAFIDPIDLLLDFKKGKSLPLSAEKGRKLLLIDIDEAINLSNKSKSNDCIAQTSFVIHSDLSFRRCTHIYSDKRNIIADNFLLTSLENILKKVDNADVCKECRELGLSRIHFAYVERGTNIDDYL